MIRKYLLAAICLTAMFSCQKVINVKINSSAQKYVIEGEINDGAGPYTITITRTRDFAENNNFEQVGGASVVISDLTANVKDTLKEVVAGTYRTARLSGVPGHNYTMSVLVSGQSFNASSVMPSVAVKPDTLFASRSDFNTDNIFMTAKFNDPLGKGNYYRIRQTIRGIAVKGSRVRGDEATDGLTYQSQLYYDTDKEIGNPIINLKDSISVELQCLNRSAYDYYRTLQDVSGDNSATPANPLTNVTGGALGIFNTCTSRRISAIAVF